jgi:hypothetical protein
MCKIVRLLVDSLYTYHNSIHYNRLHAKTTQILIFDFTLNVLNAFNMPLFNYFTHYNWHTACSVYRCNRKQTNNQEDQMKIRITKANYLYLDGKKVSEMKISPLSIGDVCKNLKPEIIDSVRKKVAKRWTMVNA